MIKKFLIILIATLLLLVSFIAIYAIFFTDDNGASIMRKLNLFPLDPVNTDGQTNERENVPFRVLGEELNEENGEPPLIRKISEGPVSGYTVFRKEISIVEEEEGTTTPVVSMEEQGLIRYINRTNGNIIESREEELGRERITNTTILKTQNALLNIEGDRALLQYLNEINDVQTLSAQVIDNEEDELKKLEGSFLEQNILSITKNPNGNMVFYLLESENGGSFGVVSGFDGSNKELIWRSPLKDFNVDWASDKTVVLTSKAHSSEEGIAFAVNTSSGKVVKLLGGIRGLTTKLSPDGTYLLYSQTQSDDILLYVKNLETGSVKEITLETLPEKCVWSNLNSSTLYCSVPDSLFSQKYPEAWYIGNVHFEDSLWKIDVDLLSYNEIMANKEGVETPFDMYHLKLSEEDKFLYFINKRDLELWSINIEKY